MNSADNQINNQQHRQQILTALNDILTSKAFAKAKKQQALLKYIVEAAINDRHNAINGYDIAIAVFNRAKDFDAQNDTLVRVAVGRLRSKLTSYYNELPSKPTVTITLPVRSYIPVIEIEPIEQPKTVLSAEQAPASSKTKKIMVGLTTTTTIVCILFLYHYLQYQSQEKTQSQTISSNQAQLTQLEAQLAAKSIQLAEQYYQQEQYLNAITHYQKATQATPQNSQTWRKLGQTHLVLNQYAQAQHALEQALEIDQQHKHQDIPINLTLIAHTYRKTRQYQQAIKSYQQILANYQTPPSLSSDIHRGIALAQSFLAHHAQASAAITTAFKQATQIKQISPQLQLKLYSSSGIIKKRQGQHLEAIVDFVKAKTLATEHYGENHSIVAQQRALLAMMYSRTHQEQKAIDEYHQALLVIEKVFGSNHSKVARLYNNITNPLLKQQQYQQAADYLQKALTINSKRADKYPISYALNLYNLGLVHQLLKQYPQALDYLQQSLNYYIETFGENHPEVGEIWQVMAQVALQMEDKPQAKSFYQQALNAFTNADQPSTQRIEYIKQQLSLLESS